MIVLFSINIAFDRFFHACDRSPILLAFKALLLNNASRRKSTAGELVNLMSVDAQRLMELMTYINSLWSSTFQICVSVYFLYNTLGLSILAGVGVMLLVIPLNMFMGQRLGSLQVCLYSSSGIKEFQVICLWQFLAGAGRVRVLTYLWV